MHLFSGISQVCLRGGKALQGSFSAAAGYFYSGDNKPEREKVRCCFLAAVKVLLTGEDGNISRASENTFRYLLEEFNPELNIEKKWRELTALPPASPSDLAGALKLMAPEDQQHAVRFLLALTISTGAAPGKFFFLEQAVSGAGMDMAHYEALCKEISADIGRREKILRSGAGVIAALIVLVVFILTATLLRSVIFGLIFAYLLLPLEKYLEHSNRKKSGPGYWLSLLAPSCRLFVRPKKTKRPFRETRQKYEELLISRSVRQTAFVLFLAILLFFGGITSLTSSWLNGVGNSVENWKIEQQNSNPGESITAVRLRQLRAKIVSVPAGKFLMERIESELADKEARKALMSLALRRSGGVLSSLFGMLGTIGTLIGDLLLTFFFGLLFLMKIAAYKGSRRMVGREYAVRTILNGNWMPGVRESTVREAERIVGGVFDRLRIWVRGYLTLMIIDGTVYTILFCLLGVPYFPVFGIIAGCGILLPYVGPIGSCLLTLFATWLGGDGSALQLLLVLGCYLVYSGIVEQFILYPLVIGESLGLTTLETIIVVLLGAVIAGIPGMILALPAASVLKYIVPQIYRCWDFKNTPAE